MIQLIAFIIFLISLIAILVMLYMKVPALVDLPKNGHHGLKKPAVLANVERKIREKHFHFFSKQMLLHKILSKFRLWILKTERYIDGRLHGIRKNAQELDKKAKKSK